MTLHPIQVTLSVPVVPDAVPEDVARALSLLWLVEQVRTRQLGVGKAAELAGVSRAEFMGDLGARGVPVIDYPLEDFERELASLGIG